MATGLKTTDMTYHTILYFKGAFKSCRIHRIYELNAHERYHKVVITSGKLEIFFKPQVSELGGVSVEKTCRMQWTQPKTKDMQRR